MRAFYAICLAVGLLTLILWIIVAGLSSNVGSWARFNPDSRFGVRGRRVVAGVLAFGMAGMSASYAPWPPPAALGAAIGGSAVAIWWAGRAMQDG